MQDYLKIAAVAAVLICFCSPNLSGHSGPFDGKNFKGRIAFSSDGNYNDEDDWGAFPVAIAILDAFGVTDKLVHVDYCNILAKNDSRFYKEMNKSVIGSANIYGIPHSILFDCQKDLDGAVESIKNAINASSTENPLYYILAGPMEVPYLGIEKSDPDKRKYVYCISHNSWNDGYTRNDQALHNHNKRDVIPSGINWIQCKDGNRNLAHPGGVGKKSTPAQWKLYQWLRDSKDSRLRWIFTRLEAELRADISDSTMTYFLMTGDEDADLGKLKRLLAGRIVPAPMEPRQNVRIEAENFRILENYAVEYRNNRRASKRLSVRLSSIDNGRISTPFDEPYTAQSGVYDVEVRYFDEKDGRGELKLCVNGVIQGKPWCSSKDNDKWTSHTIPDVAISSGDEIIVLTRGNSGEHVKLDYVQLNYKSSINRVGKKRFRPPYGPLDDHDALPGQVIVAGAKFVVMKNETYHHPRRGSRSRRYMWSCAMAGVHTLEAYHHADRSSDDKTLKDDGLINKFMEQTDFYRMKPRDDLACGSTKWVLANPGDSHIAYTYDYSGPMGIKNMTAGTYDLKWFDTVDGDMVTQAGIAVSSGNVTWIRPDSIGSKIALYIKRQN